MTRIGLRIFELLIGLLVGWLAYQFAANTNALLGIVAALLTTMLAGDIVESAKRSGDVRLLDQRVRDLLQWQGDGFSASLAITPMLKHGILWVDKTQVANAWLDLVWTSRRRYWATNYESVLWNSSVDDKVVKIQRMLVEVLSVDVRRVFILRDDSELDQYREIMQKQKEAGIRVAWITDKAIATKRHLAEEFARAECKDFSVVDSKVLFLVRTKRNQELIGAEIMTSRERCEDHERIFEHLFGESALL